MASEGPALSGHRKQIKTQSEGLNFSLLYPTFAVALQLLTRKSIMLRFLLCQLYLELKTFCSFDALTFHAQNLRRSS